MVQSGAKPILYHGTADACEGGFISPHRCQTTLHNYYGNVQQEEHIGNYIFATADPVLAHAYSLKLTDPSRNEPRPAGGVGPYQYALMFTPLKAMGDKSAPMVVIRDKEEFLAKMKNALPVVYRMPRDNAFKNVKSPSGKRMEEWVSEKDVPLDKCTALPSQGIEEAMQRGVQVFFTTRLETQDEIMNSLAEIPAMVARDMAGSEKTQGFEQKYHKRFMHYLDILTNKAGYLEHYNSTQGIAPINLKTASFDPDNQPLKQFAQMPSGVVKAKAR